MERFTYVNKLVVNNYVSGYYNMIDNSQEHSTNTVAYVATNTQYLGFQAGATYIGPGAGGINNNHGPGAGGLNSGLGAGGINNNHGPGAGGLDSGLGAESIDAGSIDRGVQLADKRTPMTKEDIRKHFLRWDKGKNGVLSKQEIKGAFYSLGCPFPDYRTLKALAHADANHDGCVNINDHEFKALIDYVYMIGYTKVN